MIRITGYGVIAEKPRVGQLDRFFHRKNYALDRKMNDTFFDGHDELYQCITMQSLRQIALRAPAVGAKTWCMFFFNL